MQIDLKNLASLLRGRRRDAGLAALVQHPEGVGLVHVLRVAGAAKPQLKVLKFVSHADHRGVTDVVLDLVNSTGTSKVIYTAVLDYATYTVFPSDSPQVPQEELAQAIRWRIKDRLDYPVDKAVVDTFPLPGVRGATQVYVVAAHDEVVQKAVALFHACKLPLNYLDIPELALLNLTRGLPENDDGMALLYLGRTNGMVLAIKGGELYLARGIDIGVNQLLGALGGRADVDEETLGACGSIDRLELEIQRTLDYFESHFGQPPIPALLVCPMEVHFAVLNRLLSDRLSMLVKDLPLDQVLDGVEGLDSMDLARCFIGLGAALRDTGE
ncbi:MAG: hypothetical protein H7831_01085 [Magnetococcus sp. WYHC-3]